MIERKDCYIETVFFYFKEKIKKKEGEVTQLEWGTENVDCSEGRWCYDLVMDIYIYWIVACIINVDIKDIIYNDLVFQEILQHSLKL